jgi:hypothetical protein
MAPLKAKGDLAELKVACDLVERGYHVAIPFGEDSDFDLVFWRPDGPLERVQVKYCTARDGVVPIRCRSASLTNGKVRAIKLYTSETVDWIAAYEPGRDECFYVPSCLLGAGRNTIYLRLEPAKNNQAIGVRYAEDYREPVGRDLDSGMEPAGLEPATS